MALAIVAGSTASGSEGLAVADALDGGEDLEELARRGARGTR
jgi:hypothetical protein